MTEADAPPPLAPLVDSHCHLDFPDFDGELPDLLGRARAAGVERMVTICTRLRYADRVRALAEDHPGVFWAAGTHPMSAAEEPMVEPEELVALASHPRLVAIGESGLDYHYTPDTKGAQQESFRRHIEAAQATGLPLVVHARDADEDVARLLREGVARRPFACVMHCFSSGERLAREALEMGFYLSASGIAAFPRSEDLRRIFAAAPPDRVLVETDAPYLAPPPRRGRRNEPAYVAHTARALAPLWGFSAEEFARTTTANFDRLFRKAAA
ncbi:TatD family hydrolase [Rubellimicrobium sp. CFH 75288]|uniref:TatD family hydrolase n=1 Tax=Rubellimicrobium sp. CFH 75288 TaxID=2697034 RepID=UPI0014126C41|nr:TatD family hydrolase [Rubellimicrobium sp. CFH 75288]NAZ35762.1 YchF/TatD family DNA exonuclease [Rubellimicrobium sp. CFH 75288]